jgi:hypothetical protein
MRRSDGLHERHYALPRKARLLVLALIVVMPVAATAGESLVRFDGRIGVIPISNVLVNADGTTTVTRNIVRTVNSAGQIWVILDLKADVRADRRIKVHGRGLLLGGGNRVGTNAGARVFATPICEAAIPFTLRSTDLAGVPLEADGDFQIDDVLSPDPPAECANPVLLRS